MSQTLNVLLGVLASTISWFLVVMIFCPRLHLSKLNRFPDSSEPCGYRYRVKVKNPSCLWDMADVSVHARLVLRGLNDERSTNSTSIRMGVGDPYPVLMSGRGADTPADRARPFTLHIHDLSGDAVRRLSPGIQAGLQARDVTLEQLMTTDGASGFVRVAVSCSHGRSGLRRTYTIRASEADIEEGEFESPGSVNIVPAVSD